VAPLKHSAFAHRLTGGKVSLADLNPRQDGGLTKQEAGPRLKALNQCLHDLQELLYAAQHQSVLILLQGMDTSGKGGTIEHVMSGVNPAGCRVTSFKKPSAEDLSHDFLWRVHPHAPGKGMMAIFDRSHYEDVLVARVRELVPEPVWQARYEHINAFEQLLADSGTIILKFFLHISKEEQLERLQAREEEPEKRWKLNYGDYEERERWDDYMRAYEAVLERCSHEHAPWYVVPSDRKWFRNLAVAQAIVDRLSTHEDEWRRTLLDRGEKNFQALQDYRQREGLSE
jgi:PPK2 family polyphosphate:nucleotide phosphotransferase